MKNLSPMKNQGFKDLFASKYTPYVPNNDFIKLSVISSQSNVIYEQKYKRKLEVYQMTLQRQNFQNFIEVHQWRSKTSLPVVKSHYLNIIDEQPDVISVEVYNQYIPFRLSQLNNIPLVQGVYILKESLIAFERLLEKFGSFYPNDKMIGINENNKCHVWLNQNFNQNKFGFTKLKQQEFCSYILDIIQKHITQSEVSIELWINFRQNPTFINIFKEIEIFQNQNGIKLPNKVQIILMEQDGTAKLAQSTKLKERKSSMTNSASSSFKKKNSIAYQSQETKVPQKNICTFGEEKTLGVTHANTSDYVRLSPSKDLKNVNKTSQTSYNSNNVDMPPKSPSTPLRHFKSNLKGKKSMFRSSEVQDMFLNNSVKKERTRKFSVKDQHNFYESENPERKRRCDEQQEDFDPTHNSKFKELLASNGWQSKIADLLSTKNVRDSVIQGGDAPIPERLIKCEKLDVFANNMVVSSIQPDEE